MTEPALRVLLDGLIDYAGLFPPASVSMADAVANYAAYRDGPDAWALGRLVVPVARLPEFAASVDSHPSGAPWPLSVLAQREDLNAMLAFNARRAGCFVIETVESKAVTPDAVATLAPLAEVAAVFVEIPVRDDPDPLVAALATHGLRAKIRTGGVSADAVPSALDVARFLAACARHDVMFKATAGLHHPLRGDFALTYAADAPRGTMFGYLNVFLAASFMRHGLSVAEATQLLDERDAGAIRLSADGVAWRGHSLTVAALADDRERFALSFGSCSFREPIDDLSALPLQ
jgi:hypothetical protein